MGRSRAPRSEGRVSSTEQPLLVEGREFTPDRWAGGG